jgi:hypothetical protein
MEIQPKALERITTASIDGPKLAEMFTTLAAETNAVNGVGNTITIDYQSSDQEIDETTWIPQIILVLRPAQ